MSASPPSSAPALHSEKVASPSLLSHATVLLSGHMAVVVMQGVQFVLLARLLGAAEFGRVASITALITIAAPFSGLGYGSVMLMRVSRARDQAALYFGNALLAVFSMGLFLVSLIVAVNSIAYGNAAGWSLALLMGLSELIAVRMCQVSTQLFQALEQMRTVSIVNATVSMCRVVAVIPLLLMASPRAEVWALTAFLMTVILSALVFAAARRHAGGFEPNWTTLRADRTDASHFALSVAAKAAYTDLDKVLIASYHGSASLGPYSSAYRLIVMAFMPVRALLDGAAARFFREGTAGGRQTAKFGLRLLKVALPYGLGVGALLYFLAPLLPWVLGPSYLGSVAALQMLCVLPAIQSIHYVFSDSLTGSGHQRVRTMVQLVALAAYVAVGIAIIPTHGWQGGALTCIFAESLLAVMIIIAVWRTSRSTVATH